MSLSASIDIIVLLSAAFTFVSFIQIYLQKKELLHLYFGLSALSIFAGYLAIFISQEYGNIIFEWARFVSITIIISALLVLIRNLKPGFARFPSYMSALPFISIVFFPLVVDSISIKELVNAIYQGGALVVCLLVFSINHFRSTPRLFFKLSLLLLVTAYTVYWFFEAYTGNYSNLITEISFSGGMILLSVGFKRLEQANQN
ncbi:MAG: hypothetical protein FH748_01755 [Balneolaceae bacterium]|nr:hypothetical protein [Balneolaceae bacterium]